MNVSRSSRIMCSVMQIDQVSQDPVRLCMFTAPLHGNFFPLEVHSVVRVVVVRVVSECCPSPANDHTCSCFQLIHHLVHHCGPASLLFPSALKSHDIFRIVLQAAWDISYTQAISFWPGKWAKIFLFIIQFFSAGKAAIFHCWQLCWDWRPLVFLIAVLCCIVFSLIKNEKWLWFLFQVNFSYLTHFFFRALLLTP